MSTYVKPLCFFLLGWFGGAGIAASYATARADHEWARMLENGMVGPTQTTHPLRG